MVFGLRSRRRGPFTISIEGCAPFEIRAGTSLLQGALDAGFAFPHRCRAGACGTCKCRLVEGNVKELTDKSYLLSADELRRGYILACQSLPTSDVRVALDRPLARRAPAVDLPADRAGNADDASPNG